MKQQLLEFWQARNARERWILLIAGALVLAFLIESAAWRPLRKARERLVRGVPEQRAQLAQLQSDAALATQLKTRAGANASNGSLMQAISDSASVAGVREQLSDLREIDSTRVSLNIQSIAFDVWLTWLAQLQTSAGAKLESGQIDALEQPGMVKVKAILAAAR